MKKINCIPMLLIAALVLCSGISETFAQPPDPCTLAKNNGNAEYNLEFNDAPGLFICVSEVIPDPWDDVCSCHEDCYYIHVRNNTFSSSVPGCDDPYGDIKGIRIIMVNDSTSGTICIGGAKRQWTETWDVKYAGGSTNFPLDTCISWGIDMQKAVDTKPGAGGNNVRDIGNHWTAKVCGSRSFLIQVFYDNNPPPPGNRQFGPFTLNTVACPEFGDDHGWP